MVRREPMLVFAENLVGKFRKQLFRAVDRLIRLFDPCDRRFADGKYGHSLPQSFSRVSYFGSNSLVNVDGKSTGTVPSGWRYPNVARACTSVMCPVIGQIWLTVA